MPRKRGKAFADQPRQANWRANASASSKSSSQDAPASPAKASAKAPLAGGVDPVSKRPPNDEAEDDEANGGVEAPKTKVMTLTFCLLWGEGGTKVLVHTVTRLCLVLAQEHRSIDRSILERHVGSPPQKTSMIADAALAIVSLPLLVGA